MTDTFNLNSTTPALVIQKLRDNGTNWADYEPRTRRAMGSKGLAATLEGRARQPPPLLMVNGMHMTPNGMDTATEEQIEAREKKINEYEQREYLAQSIILSTTSPHLSQKLLSLKTAKEMWDAVKLDATSKSKLHQVDVLTQLQTMRCPHSGDPKTHLAEVNTHFAKMIELREYLRVTSSPVLDDTFISVIISSMPESPGPHDHPDI